MENVILRPESARNLYGTLGPQCRICSGLGQVLRLGGSASGITRSASQCSCRGTGIDFETVRESHISALIARMSRLEKRNQSLERALRSEYRGAKLKMSRQGWEEAIAWIVADATAVANTTTETILFPNVLIPANYMADGRALELKGFAKWSTTTGTVTHVYKVRWGGVAGTVLATSGTVTLLVSITNGVIEFEVKIQTRSNGATGTLLVDGHSRTFAATAPTIGSATGAPALAPWTAGGQTAPAPVTVDLTADTSLAVSLTHGAASASNTATGMHYELGSRN